MSENLALLFRGSPNLNPLGIGLKFRPGFGGSFTRVESEEVHERFSGAFVGIDGMPVRQIDKTMPREEVHGMLPKSCIQCVQFPLVGRVNPEFEHMRFLREGRGYGRIIRQRKVSRFNRIDQFPVGFARFLHRLPIWIGPERFPRFLCRLATPMLQDVIKFIAVLLIQRRPVADVHHAMSFEKFACVVAKTRE